MHTYYHTLRITKLCGWCFCNLELSCCCSPGVGLAQAASTSEPTQSLRKVTSLPEQKREEEEGISVHWVKSVQATDYQALSVTQVEL